ncbi:hypothetical protein TEA_028939 [Camellia sinensis var. sinensis]|uniref:Uncharacterized protein n=1 Tax=Camellia sinensis var. sinensis TaxID=542762 RepID=A0A4S4EHS2_CAMSN|nr:hypothetical protein TEA_028939 [Camellia sinensis var. sinensis]
MAAALVGKYSKVNESKYEEPNAWLTAYAAEPSSPFSHNLLGSTMALVLHGSPRASAHHVWPLAHPCLPYALTPEVGITLLTTLTAITWQPRTDVGDVWQNVSTVKKNEIQHLTGVLQMAEEHKRVMRARVERLKKELQEFSGSADVIEKIKTGILDCNGTSNNSKLHDLQLL